MRSPYNPRADELRLPECIIAVRDASFYKNCLRRIIDLWRDEGDSRVRQDLACAVDDLNRKPHLQLGRALDRNVNVRFKAPGLVHCRKLGCRGYAISDAHWDVSDNS